MNPALYTEEAAFLSLILLIKKELIVPLNQSSLNLATSSAQNFVTYKLCIQFSHHRIEMMFLLLHNVMISKFSHYRVEVVMPSSDLETLIDIIHDEWFVIIHFISLESCTHCSPEPAVISLISQTLNDI